MATPASLFELMTMFENRTPDPDKPFYYEKSTHTINFGYGLNLTGNTGLKTSFERCELR